MDNANSGQMLEALRRKKMSDGINLTIIIGDPDETQQDGVEMGDGLPDEQAMPDLANEDEQKELGLAPDATELGETDQLEKPLAPGDKDAAMAQEDGPGMMQQALDKSPLLGRQSMHSRMKRGA